ncbi:MAG TPA: SlyX family protein [Spirochaetia bacterium]|nr:SlyX family protein [Spirochaetia bacterium]
MIEDRLVDIEIKLFYQEETIKELNSVVCEQQKQIDQLELVCKVFESQIKDLPEAIGGKPPLNEKPPHY